jgi:hypothetical protein
MVPSQMLFQCPKYGWLALCLVFLVGLTAPPGAVRAEDPPKEPPQLLLPPEQQGVPPSVLTLGSGCQPFVGALNSLTVLHLGEQQQFWTIEPPMLDPTVRSQVGASLLFLSGFSNAGQVAPSAVPVATLNEVIWLRVGNKLDFWTLQNTDEIQPIPRDWLLRVTDETPIPDPEDGRNIELDAYFQMFINAGRTADKAFYDKAHKDLTYRHLFVQPKKYRGEVVYLTGRLRRIERIDAPAMLRQVGFKHVYEGWFFVNNSGFGPVCALFTELPDGLHVGEKLNEEVGFAGYFYKKYRYESGITGKQIRFAPLLIGRVPEVIPLPDASSQGDVNQGLMPLFLSGVAATILAVLLMALYFRANDRKVRERLALANPPEFILPSQEENGKKNEDQVTNEALATSEMQKESELPLPPFPSSIQDNPGPTTT